MKVLIISAGVGDGHDSAAKALISTAPDQVSVDFLRLEEFMQPWQRWLLITSYYYLTSCLRGSLWRVVYRYGQKKPGQVAFRSLLWFGRSAGDKLCQKVLQINPDIIITTHFYTPVLLERIKKPSFKLGVIVTDFNWYNLWFHSKVDHYFVPSSFIADCVIKKSSTPPKITITGIPVRPVFHESYSKKELRQKLGLPLNKPLVLLMTGGTGLVPAEKYLIALKNYLKNWEFVMIAGRNQALQVKLQTIVKNLALPSTTVLGWTDQTADYIRAADLVITKPGGLTTSECLAAKVPLLLISPIPGHEEGNARYLEKLNLAIFSKNIAGTGAAAEKILAGETRLAVQKNTAATTLIWEAITGLDQVRKNLDSDQPKN